MFRVLRPQLCRLQPSALHTTPKNYKPLSTAMKEQELTGPLIGTHKYVKRAPNARL
jgi:hypothetical protein